MGVLAVVEEEGGEGEGRAWRRRGVGRGTEKGKNLVGGKGVGQVENSFVEAENKNERGVERGRDGFQDVTELGLKSGRIGTFSTVGRKMTVSIVEQAVFVRSAR